MIKKDNSVITLRILAFYFVTIGSMQFFQILRWLRFLTLGYTFGALIYTVLSLVFFVLFTVSGIGLFRRASWGRIFSVVSALVLIIGTLAAGSWQKWSAWLAVLLGILVIYYLTRPLVRKQFQ